MRMPAPFSADDAKKVLGDKRINVSTVLTRLVREHGLIATGKGRGVKYDNFIPPPACDLAPVGYEPTANRVASPCTMLGSVASRTRCGGSRSLSP